MYVTTTHDFRIAASVNKAAKPEHATIRLWNTKTWKEYPKPLTGHTLTITSLAFSSDDVYLVSVGRDRSWSLYKKTENEGKKLYIYIIYIYTYIIYFSKYISKINN